MSEACPIYGWSGDVPQKAENAAAKGQRCFSLFITSRSGWFGSLRSGIRCDSFNLNGAILQQRNQCAYCREYWSQYCSDYSGRQGEFSNNPILLLHNNPARIPLINYPFELVQQLNSLKLDRFPSFLLMHGFLPKPLKKSSVAHAHQCSFGSSRTTLGRPGLFGRSALQGLPAPSNVLSPHFLQSSGPFS